MTFKKQITAVFLLMCILFTPALASSASAHAYDHVYTDVTVITPGSLEDIFGETEVERAAYTYKMVELNSSRAAVALEMELKIGHDYYTTIVSGTVNAYALPSGDTFYEGPIDGSMMVDENEYEIIVGFSKLKSDGISFVSMTIQNKLKVVAFSFGENMIKGEVADFFIKRSGNSQQGNFNSEINSDLLSSELTNDLYDTVSPAAFDGPGIFPITPPIYEYPNIGKDGTYVHQSTDFHMWDTTYSGSKSLVYWDETRNFMMVFVKPFTYHTQEFAKTLQYDATITTLETIEISLSLEPNAESSKLAHISGTYIPNDISMNILGGEYVSNVYFKTLLEALLDEAGIDLELVEAILQDIEGSVTYNTSNDYFYNVCVDVGVNTHPFDELDPGFPVRFDLLKNSQTYYVGNTDYSVTTKVRYLVMGYTRVLGQEDVISYSYLDSKTSHTTYTITLS